MRKLIFFTLLFIITGCEKESSSSFRDIPTTVLDNITGLTWMDTPEVETISKTFSQAIEYCQELHLDKYSDWRVPTIQELYTIVDINRSNPSTLDIFQYNSALSYWSSDSYSIDTNLVLGINFYDGSDGVILATTPRHIRCVRGDSLPNLSFTSSEKDTVIGDSNIWQDTPTIEDNFLTYEDARTYCDALILSDSDTWRLPSIQELHSIVDRRRFNPASHQSFSYTVNGFFWSATPYQAESDKIWTIFFADGNDYQQSKNDKAYVRCINNKERDED